MATVPWRFVLTNCCTGDPLVRLARDRIHPHEPSWQVCDMAQVVLVVGLLFAKTVYQELEVDTEMQHGLLPGCLALAAKFVPTMKQVRRGCVLHTILHIFAHSFMGV